MRNGPVGTVQRAGRKVRPVPRRVFVHIWYAMDLSADDRPHPRLGDELVLRRGTGDDLWLLEQLPPDPSVSTMSPWLVQDWLRDGGSLWLVQAGNCAAFRCWVFRDRCPMDGARGGGIRPPVGAVVLKDILSSPAFRGRGIAPAASAAVADAYRDEGARWMYTKVDIDNAPSRRAVEKAGFREVARMQTLRRYWWRRIRVAEVTAEPAHHWLRGLVRG